MFDFSKDKKISDDNTMNFRREFMESLQSMAEEYQKVIAVKDSEIEEYKRIIAYYEEAFTCIRRVLSNQEKITDKTMTLVNTLANTLAKAPDVRGGDSDAE